MAWKKPVIYLTNGKKPFCSLCKCDMIAQEKEFEMLPANGNNSIRVKAVVLFCPGCKNHFITQSMSRQLVQQHPGYYVDTSIYDLKPKKKNKNAHNTDTEILTPVVQENAGFPNASNTKSPIKRATVVPVSGINAEVYLTNTYATGNNICPLCSSVLGKELVNIPVIERNGDFYRYYVENVKYCYKCRKAFVAKDNITGILTKINSTLKPTRTVKLENATAYYSEHQRDYLFSPTLNNTYAIFHPGQDYHAISSSQSGEMELNAQSFLGEMGYSVNKGINIRHHILLEAIKQYGKRRVSDHIAFLIATRKAQINGERKYAHAIRIWQDDLNYIADI